MENVSCPGHTGWLTPNITPWCSVIRTWHPSTPTMRKAFRPMSEQIQSSAGCLQPFLGAQTCRIPNTDFHVGQSLPEEGH